MKIKTYINRNICSVCNKSMLPKYHTIANTKNNCPKLVCFINFIHQTSTMKRGYSLLLMFFPVVASAQTEVGPAGHQLLWILIFLVLAGAAGPLLSYLLRTYKGRTQSLTKKSKIVSVTIQKNKLVSPTTLTLTVRNSGTTPVDLEAPVLQFIKIGSQRKFRLKNPPDKEIYPLFLEPKREFSVPVELSAFYKHDKSLRGYSRLRISVRDVSGPVFHSASVALRKSLFL